MKMKAVCSSEILISTKSTQPWKPEIAFQFPPMAVPWLRRLVAGLSLSRFVPRSVDVGFMVNNVAGSSVFPVNVIPQWLSILIYNMGDE
jgi:hypothetical protein